jgi:hypothetical protein
VKVLQSFAVIGIFILFISGCSFEEDLAGSEDPLYPPTGLMAATVDSNSVLLTWTPSPNDSDSRFQSYKLFWSYTTAADSIRAHSDSVELTRGTSQYTVTGLANGVEYYFVVSVNPSDIALKFFPSIRWASAPRYSGISLPVQNVLALFDSAQTPPGPAILNPENAEAKTWGDIYLDSDGSVKSTSLKGSGWRRTLFSTVQQSAPAVPVPRSSFPSISTFTDTVIAIQPQTIYFCKTQDGHYARLYVQDIPSMGGPGMLVHFDISYQTAPNLPFAKRAQK